MSGPFDLRGDVRRVDLPATPTSAVGGGLIDDTARLLADIEKGKPVDLLGMTVRITEQHDFGSLRPRLLNGRVLFDFAEDWGWRSSGGFALQDVDIDGGDTCGIPIWGYHASASGPIEITRGSFRNVYRDASIGTNALRADNPSAFTVVGTAFESICTPGDSTQGNSPGAVAGILLVGAVDGYLIDLCTFEDINNRATAGGTLQYEDAEAISMISLSGGIQRGRVQRCRFTNIGKRWLKVNVPATSKIAVSDLSGASPYTATTDDSGTMGNGMYSLVSVYGGAADLDDVRMDGGVIQFPFDLAGSGLGDVTIRRAAVRAEYHRYANQSYTRFLSTANTIPATSKIVLDRCVGSGTFVGPEVRNSRFEALDCDITSAWHGFYAQSQALGEFKVAGCTARQEPTVSAASLAPSLIGRGIYVESTQMSSVQISNNKTWSKYDGCTVDGQTKGGVATVVDNQWGDPIRDSLTLASADSSNLASGGANNVNVWSPTGNRTHGPINRFYWTKTAVTAAADDGGGYSEIAKTSTAVDARAVIVYKSVAGLQSDTDFLSGTATEVEVDFYNGSGTAAGSATKTSGPGTLVAVSGSRYRITGLDASTPTIVRFAVSGASQEMRIFPGGAASTTNGASIKSKAPVTVLP